jgi:hypothetical protein
MIIKAKRKCDHKNTIIRKKERKKEKKGRKIKEPPRDQSF